MIRSVHLAPKENTQTFHLSACSIKHQVGVDIKWSLCMCGGEGSECEKLQKTSLCLLRGRDHRPRMKVEHQPLSGTVQSVEPLFTLETDLQPHCCLCYLVTKVKVTVGRREKRKVHLDTGLSDRSVSASAASAWLQNRQEISTSPLPWEPSTDDSLT